MSNGNVLPEVFREADEDIDQCPFCVDEALLEINGHWLCLTCGWVNPSNLPNQEEVTWAR